LHTLGEFEKERDEMRCIAHIVKEESVV